MLVLSRKRDEVIAVRIPKEMIVGAEADIEIKLTVVEIRGDKVRIGIDAPKEIPIHRGEVWEAIYAEQMSEEQARASLETDRMSVDESQEPLLEESNESDSATVQVS